MPELEIRNLHVNAGDKVILRGVDLKVGSGEIHALMGPNGSGKSTLANVIMGHPNLEVTEGQVIWDGQDITEADTDERSRLGLFMAFQYPVAIPGVTVTKYLRTVLNAHRASRDEEPIPLREFRKTVQDAMELTKVPEEFSRRYLNDGFSGGEKKKHGDPPAGAPEALAGDPRRDRLRVSTSTRCGPISEGVNTVAAAQGSDLGLLIITHYQRILHLVQVRATSTSSTRVRIVKQGGPELVDVLEEKGYGWITEPIDAAEAESAGEPTTV